MLQLREKADKHGLQVHMDGARLMNAVAALDVQPRDIVQYVDTLTMCFSKVWSVAVIFRSAYAYLM